MHVTAIYNYLFTNITTERNKKLNQVLNQVKIMICYKIMNTRRIKRVLKLERQLILTLHTFKSETFSALCFGKTLRITVKRLSGGKA